MRRYGKAVRLAAILLATAPAVILPVAPAQAVLPVTDAGAILNLVRQYAQQAQMYATQLQQYQNMLTNTARLPSQVWGQAMQSINQVNSLLQQAQSLSFAQQNLAAQFQQKFPGFNTYGGQTVNMPAKFAQWSTDTNSSVSSTLGALGLQQSQMQNEEAVMQQLQSMGGTAGGQMQALQVGNQMAAQAVRQTQELRQLVMIQTQMEANKIAQDADQQALWNANGQKAYAHANYATTGGKGY